MEIDITFEIIKNMEKIFIQNQDSTGTVNSGILVVSTHTISDSTSNSNYEIMVVNADYDSISNHENSTRTGFPVTESLSRTGILVFDSFVGSYIVVAQSDAIVSLSSTFLGNHVSHLVEMINQQDGWFAIAITKQNENSIYDGLYQIFY